MHFILIDFPIMQFQVHYIWPLNSNIKREFEDIWNKISKQAGGSIISHTIPVMFGRYFKLILDIFQVRKSPWICHMIVLCFLSEH